MKRFEITWLRKRNSGDLFDHYYELSVFVNAGNVLSN